MEVHDLLALTRSLPTLDLARRPTHEEAMAAAPLLGGFEGCEVRVARFSGQPPWERHTAGDELIHVLDGAVAVTVLDEVEPRTLTLEAGTLVVMPAGVWHRSNARERVTVLVVTPAEGNESSFDDDPRSG